MTPSQRVLVVEDEQFVRDAIRDALALDGVECELATSGAEAQKAIEDPRIACVVLDVRVTQPNSIGLLQLLREARPALRVIVLSSHTDQDLVLEALRRGACDYLAKPIHEEELRLAVRRALDAYAIESRWDSVRERLQRLVAHGAEFERVARQGVAREELASRVVAALSDVLGAARASLLRVSEDGSRLRVEAGEGLSAPPDALGDVLVAKSVSGLAVREGQALLIDDIDRDPRCADRERRTDYQSSSVVLAPLDTGAGVRGVLCATDRSGGASFGQEDLALLLLLAQQADRWLEPPASGLPAHSEAQVAAPATGEDPYVELLREVCEGMTREIEPVRMLTASLRPIARATSARVVSLYLIDNRSGRLVCEAQCEGSDADRAELPRELGLSGGSLQSGALVATDRPARDARFDPEVDTPESGAPGPLLLIPLRVRDRVLGLARIFPAEEVGASPRLGELLAAPLSAATRSVLLYRSLLESVEDVARARRDAEGRRSP